MKFFQRLLVAPAAVGLIAPLATHAAELNLSGVNQYASSEQVTSINQFSDVNPADWAYQALSNLIERYGCVAGYPDGTYRGQRAMTRYEAAALLNACLDRITEITDELKKLLKEFEKELAVIRGRVDSLEAKVGELEATRFSTTTKLQGQATFVLGAVNASGDSKGRGINPEISAFNQTTAGQGPFGGNLVNAPSVPAPIRNNRGVITNQAAINSAREAREKAIARNNRDAAKIYNQLYGATSFNYDVRLNFITSFTGKDQLYTRIRSGNFSNAFNGNGVNLTALDVASNGFGNTSCTGNRDCSDVVGVDRLYYRFPLGSQFEAIVGAKYRNTEFLGANPGVYGSGKGDRILDIFSLNGAPGVYNKATGSGGGLIWKTPYKLWSGRFSLTASYVSPVGDNGATNSDNNPFACSNTEGGIGNDCSRASFLGQLGWTSKTWGVSAAYRYGQRGSNFRRGTNYAASNSWWLSNGQSNSVAVNAYAQPSSSGLIPSVSVGWGLNNLNNNHVRSGAVVANEPNEAVFYAYPRVTETQSWYVGLQWNDVFLGGNSAGMAVGQPTFATSLARGSNRDSQTLFSNDGNYAWEWWYKFQVSDNISVTPALFWLSRPLGALTDGVRADGSFDRSSTFGILGGLVQTTIRF
ncbi:MAG: S-layer homology domain-containing protein [Cyanobacteria bacterium K_Offshore_surface_m2_239]|nr:S-layer homology domain-containing protein [Cyanobacteria bacterium K_Offshore_surface_m2_239]